MEVSAESKKAPFPIVFSFDPFSKVMVDRDEQTEIAYSSIVSTLAGISIDVKAVP